MAAILDTKFHMYFLEWMNEKNEWMNELINELMNEWKFKEIYLKYTSGGRVDETSALLEVMALCHKP